MTPILIKNRSYPAQSIARLSILEKTTACLSSICYYAGRFSRVTRLYSSAVPATVRKVRSF